MKPIAILVVEDHQIVREGLINLLKMEKDFEVVGEARNGRKGLAMAQQLNPDVVLMDIAMPILNGLETTRQMIKAMPHARVIILSAHCDDAYVSNASDSGAVGFLLKQSSSVEVCQAIRSVNKGKTHFTPSVSKRIQRLQQQRGHLGTIQKSASLTSREMEVLQLIAEGKANKETADELGISIKTVEKHRTNLMQKLDLHETASLVRYAIEAGIIESSVQLTVVK